MMAGDSQRVVETTTINYNGMIAVLDPTSSWTAKWLHIGARSFIKDLAVASVPALLPCWHTVGRQGSVLLFILRCYSYALAGSRQADARLLCAASAGGPAAAY